MFPTSSQTFSCSRETLSPLRKLMKVISQSPRMDRVGRDTVGIWSYLPAQAESARAHGTGL